MFLWIPYGVPKNLEDRIPEWQQILIMACVIIVAILIVVGAHYCEERGKKAKEAKAKEKARNEKGADPKGPLD